MPGAENLLQITSGLFVDFIFYVIIIVLKNVFIQYSITLYFSQVYFLYFDVL